MPSLAISSGLVIAEVYGGGGNSGAPYQNDFVVLFNRGESSQNVEGWSIQYQAQSGTDWTVIPLNNSTIPAGGFHLVQLAGGANGSALPTPDTTSLISLSASQGKIALVSSITALAGQCPNDPGIVDKIGYGSTSQVCNETANAAAPGNTQSIQRKQNGCAETDNNSQDFALAAPNPRNAATPASICPPAPPEIVVHPLSQTLATGRNATLFVVAAGAEPLAYRWRLDGADLPGATASNYSILGATPLHGGEYTVVVSNVTSMATSAVARVLVGPRQLPTWGFNDTNLYAATAPLPVGGQGSATILGGVSATLNTAGSPNDPIAINAGITNAGWSLGSFPAVGAGNKTAGIQFRVDTTGYQNLRIRWDQRHSGSASRYTRFQYSVDGENFVDGPVFENTNTSASATYIARTNDLSGIPLANNNPNFAFRLVTEFEATATSGGSASYVPTDAGVGYSSVGTIRIDFVSVFSAVEIPRLAIVRTNGNVMLTWPDSAFGLYAGAVVDGIYTNIAGATNPHTLPASEQKMYFRLGTP